MSMGSLGHYMHDLSAAGFGSAISCTKATARSGSTPSRIPRPVAAWIAIEERAEGGDALNWQAKNDADFLPATRVAEGGGVGLYRQR